MSKIKEATMIYPCLGEVPEIPDTGTSVETWQLHLCVATAAMKTNCDEIFSLADKLTEHTRSFSGLS